MNLAVCVLTFNVYQLGRLDEFRTTLRSLAAPGVPVFLIDNGSTDETADLVRRLGGWRNPGPNLTIGAGMNAAVGAALGAKPDVVVFSNDDMRWHDGWADQVRVVWADAPEDIALCGGLIERKTWSWNTPEAAFNIGGVRVLQRKTVPAGAWTFRAQLWPDIGPIPDQDNCWTDVPTSLKLTQNGYRIVCADWADHLCYDRSAWGNHSWDSGEPLDLRSWGFPQP